MIARADQGGLAAQTWEFNRHLKPERTLIWAGRSSRGTPDVTIYSGDVRVTTGVTFEDARWLCTGVDTIWSAETWYGDYIQAVARNRDVRLVLHANPEMGVEKADVTWLPTTWLQDLYPQATVTPFPVAEDVLPTATVPIARTFYHVASGAMEDRNGTGLVMDALPFVQHPCRLLIRGANGPSGKHGNVEVTYLGHEAGLYYRAWPRVDALVLPRRFGGLCLPMQEAMAQGLPVIGLDRVPEADWLHERLAVPVVSTKHVRMKGGWFEVADAHPASIAARMDLLFEDEALVEEASLLSLVWADQHSWERWLDVYTLMLRDRPVPG